MLYDTLELTDQEVLCQVQDHLEKALLLHAEGTTCTTDDLFKVLLSVAAGPFHPTMQKSILIKGQPHPVPCSSKSEEIDFTCGDLPGHLHQ